MKYTFSPASDDFRLYPQRPSRSTPVDLSRPPYPLVTVALETCISSPHSRCSLRLHCVDPRFASRLTLLPHVGATQVTLTIPDFTSKPSFTSTWCFGEEELESSAKAVMMHADISRAFFHAPSKEEKILELPTVMWSGGTPELFILLERETQRENNPGC